MANIEGIGRSRGRARGRPDTAARDQPSSIDMRSLEQPLGAIAGNNGGNGNGATIRGRAGYRVSAVPLCTRPQQVERKTGTAGTPVKVVANYFRLKTPKNVIVYDYHIEFEPQIEAQVLRKALLFNHRQAFGERMLFDNNHNLKSTTLLPNEETDLFSIRKTDNEQIRIRVKRVGEISWDHQEMLRLYNTQMRRNLQLLKWNLIGRHYFNPNIRHKLTEHKLEILQGLLTAINRHDNGDILMVADTVHKIIRLDTVYQNLQDIYRRDRSTFKDNARRELTGNIVITSYNNKTYRIDDIAFDKNPLTTFERKQTTTSIKDYYREQYDINIRDENQPLLIVMPSIRDQRAGQQTQILLVPELCNMTGISDSMATDFNIRRAMTQKTQQEPNLRVNNLNGFIRSVTTHPQIQEEMGRWGLQFDNNLVEVQARVLDCESILMQGQNNTLFDQKSGDFSKEIRGKAMFAAVNIGNWTIICTQRDRNIVDDFANTLNRVCRPLGVNLNRPQVHVIDNERTSTFVSACNSIPPTMQIVVVILPNNNKERYDAIKKIFCCEHPLASQLIVQRTLSKKQMLMSVCTKIGIQMACKLGAQPWALDIPPKDLMVVGFDVHRDMAQRERAIGAFVCSTNATLTKWYSRVSPHKNREELSNNFRTNFELGLKRYYDINKKSPLSIIVYRDGVSEGDIEYVYNYELKQIEDGIKHIFTTTKIKLCFIIVTKRINTRFFAKLANNQFDNPTPGTVVDSVVTRDERYDFFLISQSVRQGTVTPTMYNIIKDDTNWFPHRHQQLAYKLTHLYYNWIGTIRVPAPCQYAHKLAYLTGTALHRPIHNHLSDTLFYL